MSDLIQATVVGRLTRDAELRQAGSGQVCGFRVAATPYKSEAMFLDVSVWGRRGEALQPHLTKGQQVVVVGDLTRREFEHNGERRVSLELNATAVALVGSRGQQAPASDDSDDDKGLPF
ncbi:MAG: single-stranded DNA-binding protein [Solirubrobacterales bacterium]|nr:single-stranded DNA-binding protein [Solirubrobacterales bacterium]